MLDPNRALPGRPQRVLVAGTSGAGKTTTSARIAALLHIEHIEIDALYHGPDWTPRERFLTDVEEFSARPQWVTEWQYGTVREQLVDRAWNTHHKYPHRIDAIRRRRPDLTIVRLRTRADIERWVDGPLTGAVYPPT
ncbi:MAG: AAA family ATPase [Rhodococcus sp. (in: high G+C Gram-positive bacteria)]|nr:MAG: AAA family ATPase [Rhodococcus sp. (in: high G+C Gram-positive bacteria)]